MMLFFTVWLLVVVVLWPTEEENPVKKKVRQLQKLADGESEDNSGERKSETIKRWLADTVSSLLPARYLQAQAEQLAKAGRPLSATSFALGRIGLAMVCLLLAITMIGRSGVDALTMSFSMILIVCSVLLPRMWITSLIEKRRREVIRALPDMIDLLCVSVEAGLGLDAGLQRIADKFGGAVADELREYLKQVRLGSGRVDALRQLGNRSSIEELHLFTAALIQAEQLGVGIARVLRVQSEQLRERRRQRAEEQGMKIPVKILFPMVLFVFPALFIVLLGPAAITLFNNLVG